MLTFSAITINIALSSDSLKETKDVNLHEEATEQFDNHSSSRDNYHVSWRLKGQYNIQLMSDSEVRVYFPCSFHLYPFLYIIQDCS